MVSICSFALFALRSVLTLVIWVIAVRAGATGWRVMLNWKNIGKKHKRKGKNNRQSHKKKKCYFAHLLSVSSPSLRPSLLFNFPVSLSGMPVRLVIFFSLLYLLFVFLGLFRLFLNFLHFFYAYAFIIYFAILQFTILPVRPKQTYVSMQNESVETNGIW